MENNTIAKFIQENGITVIVDRIHARPDRLNQTAEENQWGAKASHWCITIYHWGNNRGTVPRTGSMTVLYSMGSAHKKNPSAADVLDNIASDVTGYENARNFTDWASDYGYDTDSIKAKHTYNTIGEQVGKLKMLLNNEQLYHDLLFNTERL